MPVSVEEYAEMLQQKVMETVEQRQRLLDAVKHPDALVFYDWFDGADSDALPMCVYVGDIAHTKYGDTGEVIAVNKDEQSITIKRENWRPRHKERFGKDETEEFSIERITCASPPPLK